MSSSSSWSTISTNDSNYDEELALEAKRALAYLQTKRNYRYVEFLAQGGYGWVALVYDDAARRPLAIKCTSETSEMELSWWIKLEHPNILPLLEYITLDTCTVFIMPAMRKDLFAVVNEERFYEEELSFGLCRIWLRDVASGLAYMHGQFLCHLDLKLDNVFIKEDGYACLGDFSLISDIREVPRDFNFLEVYEPPEYTEWCHASPPKSVSSGTLTGGDKADMWQYGILTVDLLSNMKLTGSKSSRFTLFHHDVWPLLQKMLLHPEYLNYLLEETFVNVVFKKKTLELCHEFLKGILCLDPDKRMSAEEAKNHGLTTAAWPELPKEFTLPKRVEEHLPEPKPLPREELDDPNMSMEDVLKLAEQQEEEVHEKPSKGALDVIKRKVEKMHREKMNRRESIALEAGQKLVNIQPAPSSSKALDKKIWTTFPKTDSPKDKGQSSPKVPQKSPAEPKKDTTPKFGTFKKPSPDPKKEDASKAAGPSGKGWSAKVTTVKKGDVSKPGQSEKKKKPWEKDDERKQ